MIKKDETTEPFVDVVKFRLAHEIYGFELAHIQEVYSVSNLTPVPCTPPFVLGIINVRGQIFSVINLKIFFDLPDEEHAEFNKAIIIQAGHSAFGILADAILGVESIPRRKIQSSLPTLSGIQAEYVKGITNDPLIILDAPKILADPQMIVNEKVAG